MRTNKLGSLLFVVSFTACAAPAAPPPAAPVPAPVVAPVTRTEPPPALGALWVDHGVCPGECCTYGAWTATAPVQVMDVAQGTRVLTRLAVGEKVRVSTGDLYVTPVAAKVVVAHALSGDKGARPLQLAVGDTVWVLSPLGEGFVKLWADGRFFEAEALFLYDESCAGRPSDSCWAVAEAAGPPAPWWVKVKTAAGSEGWVDNTQDVLTGFDGCG